MDSINTQYLPPIQVEGRGGGTDTMISDIMVANPHTGKSDILLTALDNRLDPMPDSLWFDIIDAADSLGGKEILENELSSWTQIKDICLNQLIGVYRNDTLHSWAGDSLVSLLTNEPSLKAKYNLIFWYIENRDFQSAINVLQAITSNFSLSVVESLSHQKMAMLLPLLDEFFNDSTGFECPDSVQTAALFQLISDVDDLPGSFARNILLSCGLISYEEPVVTGNMLKQSKRTHRVRETQTHESFVKVYPNPCREYLIVEYLNTTNSIPGFLEFKDIHGRTILTTQLSSGYDQKIISVSDFQPGVYYLFYIDSQGKKNVHKIVTFN